MPPFAMMLADMLTPPATPPPLRLHTVAAYAATRCLLRYATLICCHAAIVAA